MAYISKTDLENALSPQAIVAIFDDDGDQVADPGPIAALIADAEAYVDSYLGRTFTIPLVNGGEQDPLVSYAAKYVALTMCVDRKPEYFRKWHSDPRDGWRAEATRLLQRIQAAQQIPPVLSALEKPGNLGGIVYDSGPRLMIDSSDGTDNGSGF